MFSDQCGIKHFNTFSMQPLGSFLFSCKKNRDYHTGNELLDSQLFQKLKLRHSLVSM